MEDVVGDKCDLENRVKEDVVGDKCDLENRVMEDVVGDICDLENQVKEDVVEDKCDLQNQVMEDVVEEKCDLENLVMEDMVDEKCDLENLVKVVVAEDKCDLESRVEAVKKELESVTIDDAEKTFEQVCSKFQNLLNNIEEMVLEHSLPEKDSLVELSFTAIRTINSVFCSMEQDQKEHNKDFLLRSLNRVTTQKFLPFSPKQLEEINVMALSLEFSPVSSNNLVNDVNDSDGVGVVNKFESQVVSEKTSQGSTFAKKFDVDAIPVEFSNKIQPVSSGYLTSGVSNSKLRLVSLPLLDLHKDHDIDSLPSPTREAPPSLPIHLAFDFGHGSIKPEWPVPKVALSAGNMSVHPYETDALKAVSSYQQKFGQTSFFTSDKLPSPTPSNDGNISDDDTCGEVASAPHRNAQLAHALNMGQPPVSTVCNPSMFPGQKATNTWGSGPMTHGHVPALKSSLGKRSKDPRLRLASDENTRVSYQDHINPSVNMEPRMLVNSRKQKTLEDQNLDTPVVKRQRGEIIGGPASKGLPGLSGNMLQDIATSGLQIQESNHVPESYGIASRGVEHGTTRVGTFSNSVSMNINQSHNVLMPGHIATSSLESLLKDIAVNPSLLMNLVNMEQQKSAYPFKSSTQHPTSDSILGAMPVMTMAPPRPSVPGPKDRGLLRTPSQRLQVDGSTNVRMKPRDPRRVLHGDSSKQRGGNAIDQTNITSSVPRQEEQPGSFPQGTQPDIGQQLIKNLKNIGDIMSVSQATTSQTAVSQMQTTQAIPYLQSKVERRLASESGKTQGSTRSVSEDVGPSRPQHSWSGVEHLFDGYDDKQKAAIQKERSRRMEEQRKMFAAKKLCLVLDLDHTLLNSAKFCEVDPKHEEILREKEELDRQMPQRHLFRSPHMSMWTKLRPGIWKFLEKASNLFELHVYTMGNKVYATEMAKLLDPKGELFAGRVISRGDDGDLSDGDERIAKSKDLEGVLGMESSVIIIDDSVRVWPHNKLNMVVVERYLYFPCSRRQFGLVGDSLLELDRDERPEDGTLASSLAVIERVHQNFFTHQSLEEVDVRNLLAAEQRKILAGCRIVFSRVFPVGEANPHLHPLWQTAEQFGAVCTTQIDEQVTHVVANSLGTDKVHWAISNGRFVVRPGWVEASTLLYRRANEHEYGIKPQ
ncbi:hypothetical protein Leryth_010787 [Lithospermum erythrorhizon]|nr:hypothetical protein Leryth_010787 [Lithospermum erythrorhizon]